MPEDEIFLIVKVTINGKCPRFSPPPSKVYILYRRESPAVIMLGPEKGEINYGIGPGKTIDLMEKIIEDPLRRNCTVRKISEPDAASIFKQIIANCQRVAEEPSLAPAVKGFTRERFDQIAGSYCV